MTKPKLKPEEFEYVGEGVFRRVRAKLKPKPSILNRMWDFLRPSDGRFSGKRR